MRKLLAVATALLLCSALCQAQAAKLLAQGRANEALHALAQPRNAQEFNLQCRVYYSLEQWDAAVGACERAVRAEPQNALYQLWLARAYGNKADQVGGFSALGLARKAAACFEKAFQLQPSSEEARHDLAEYYLNAPGIAGGGRDKAVKLAAQASQPLAAWIHGIAAEKQGNQSVAERELRLAVQASGYDGDKWLDLAEYFRAQKRWNDFEATVAQAVNARKKQPSVLYEAAQLLVLSKRNLPAAEAALRQYLAGPLQETAPAFRAHYLLGRAREMQGDAGSAANEYRAALALASSYRPAQEALKHLGRR